MAEAARMVDAPARARRRGGAGSIAGCLALSALASVAVEWAGMTWWWPDEGAEHAARVLRREVGYLNADFRASAGPILGAAERGYFYLFEWTGLGAGLHRLGGTVHLTEYVRAGLDTLQVLMVRVVLLVFSAPAFLLFGVVGLAGGLTLRDIRRWSAGREFGGVYHMAKRGAPRVLAGAAFVYLGLPFAVHPSVVIVPGAALFGAAVCVVAASFKKYL